MTDLEMESAPLPDELPVGETAKPGAEETPKDDAELAAEASKEGQEPPVGEPGLESDVDAEVEAKPEGETKQQRRRRMRRERFAGLNQEVDRLTAEVQRLQAENTALQAPNEQNYPNPDDYIADRAAFAARQQMTQAELQRAEAAVKHAEGGTQQARQEAVNEVLQEGSAKHPDFEVVVKSMPLTQDGLSAAMEAENAADVLYHLGKNPAEASRIAQLPPVAQAVEIGILSTRLTPPKPKPTSAPPPINHLRGNSGKVEKAPDEMTTAEYRKWRMGQ